MVRLVSWRLHPTPAPSGLALALALFAPALGCRLPPATIVVDQDPAETESDPPPVWSERQPEREVERPTSIDAALHAGKVIGIAHGPDRADEAEGLAERMTELGITLDDVWAVRYDDWYSDGIVHCSDQVVYYNDESAELAAQLRDALPGGLYLTQDVTGSPYDVIVQLCPNTRMPDYDY